MSRITKILNGKGIAVDIRLRLAEQVAGSRIKPGLAVVLVGEDPASLIYIDFKKKASKEVGIVLTTVEFPADVKEKVVLKKIQELNHSKHIHGIIVQLPLPSHLDEEKVIEAVDPEKDVDGLHPINMGKLALGFPRFVPATPRGMMRLLEETHRDLEGTEVVVVGASTIVGKPMALLMADEGATVTLCHEHTRNLSSHTKRADVLISATGQAGLINGEMVKEGVIVLDAGITRKDDGIVGDVLFEEVSKKAAYITPVPGGVGPMTVAMLLENTWQAMRLQEGYAS